MRLLKVFVVLFVVLFAAGCVSGGNRGATIRKQLHEVVIRVEAKDPTKVEVSKKDGKEKIIRAMDVDNPEGALSNSSFVIGDEAFMKIFSGLSVSDVSSAWNDFTYLLKATKIRKVNIFLNSPGGDAFSGLALADQIKRAQKLGFHVTIHASGIVASAAVPVFAMGDRRLAAGGTIFMVHETSLWKWPGRETASDIRSQNKLMDLIRDRYIGLLADHSKLNKKEWGSMEHKTTWFSVEQAKKWGLVDEIE